MREVYMIDTRLETFLTLCRLMNYRKTAEALNMTQPAVTQHIHYLENLYHCKLFLYDRKALHMTEEAKMLKIYAENVLYQEKKLKSALCEKNGIHLAIGATKTIGEYVIADHIASFLQSPQNHISVNVDNTENLLLSLQNGEIDFALIEGFFDRMQYASKLYRKEPFVGLCGVHHPFANQTVSPDDIFKEHLILRETGSGTRKILEQLLAEHNHTVTEFSKITTVSNFGLITALLEKGIGITFAYRAVGERNPELAEFRVQDWNIAREFNYVYLDTPYAENNIAYFDKAK